ncbi:MAG: YceD family protein [Actinomycetes bacterium]
MSGLDGRAPFVVDIRELGRRPGAMMLIQRTEPAPKDLLNPMVEVPAGSGIVLDVTAESVIEGVLITGTASTTVHGSCSRCLEPMSEPLEVEILELFRYGDLDPLTEDEEELPTLDGDLLDLEPTVRDCVVLALPLAPVCSEDCQGLCPECGVLLADQPDHHHDQIDPRWTKLTGVFEPTSLGDSQGTSTKD